jgi:hypothetical protein
MGQGAPDWQEEIEEDTKITDEVSTPVFEVSTDSMIEKQDKGKTTCPQEETTIVQPINTQNNGVENENKK